MDKTHTYTYFSITSNGEMANYADIGIIGLIPTFRLCRLFWLALISESFLYKISAFLYYEPVIDS